MNKASITVPDLLGAFSEETLSEFKRPWGTKTQKVGKRAMQIMLMAKALCSGQQTVLQTPSIPPSVNYVMFDLEGMPPQLDEPT